MRSSVVRSYAPEAALVLAAACFGVTFVMVKDAVQDVTPAGFIVLRFALGSVTLAPFAWLSSRRSSAAGARRAGGPGLFPVAVALGVALATGYMLQTTGLKYTSASNSAFITGLFVVFTPLIQVVLRHRGLGSVTATAVTVAAAGLFLITGADFGLGGGDALTLGCAFAFAVQIVLLGVYARRFDPVVLNTAQMAALAVLTLPALAVTGVGSLTGRAWLAIVVTGLACSSFAFTLQVYGQSHTSATRSALLLSLEPVFAAMVGYAVGEGLGAVGAVGAVLILLAIVIEEAGGARQAGREGLRSGSEAAPPRTDVAGGRRAGA
jgi:drug/metabolite transporter (DMT)-like permease